MPSHCHNIQIQTEMCTQYVAAAALSAPAMLVHNTLIAALQCMRASCLTWVRPAVQAHHLLNLGACINQGDARGFTPLHRAAHLAHLNGYLELYEYLLVGTQPGCMP